MAFGAHASLPTAPGVGAGAYRAWGRWYEYCAGVRCANYGGRVLVLKIKKIGEPEMQKFPDIVWFRNPMPHYPDGDFQIACDHFTGNPDDLRNKPNSGFTYVRSNTETIEFYKFWYAAREKHPGFHDQDVLNFIKRDPYLSEIGVRIKFLSTEFFGGLCEPSRNLSRVCTMHANCCIGLRRKIDDLNVMLQDWKRFMSLPHKDKHSVSWSVPRNCSLKKLEQ